MKTVFPSFLLLLFTNCWLSAALAQGAGDAVDGPAAPGTPPSAATVSGNLAPSNSSATRNDSSVSKKTFGFIVGATVGTPVSLVRRTVEEEKYGVHGLIGDSTNKVARLTAGAFWLPFSMVLGALESPCYGPANSLRNVNRPFTKDQMGLGTHLTSAFEKTEPAK